MTQNNEPLIITSQNDKGQSNSSSKEQPLSQLEKLVDRVGGQGRYQILSFLIFSFMWFVTSWLLVGQTFFFDSNYKCFDIEDKQQCQKFICAAQSFQRQSLIRQHADSIVFAFQNYMICDYEYLVNVLQSMLFVGSLIGFFVFPYVADNWGRKLGIKISWAMCTIGIAFISFADGSGMIGLGFFLAGFGSNPAITLCLTFINQQTLGKSRQFFGVGVQLFLALGEGTIGFMFIINLHWYQVGYIMIGFAIILNILMFYLVQSPKFLIKSNHKQALNALNQIAVKNNKPLVTEEQFDCLDISKQIEGESGASFMDLFKFRSLRKISIPAGLIFLAISSIYYSVSLNLNSIGSNQLINQEIVSISQFCSYIFAEIMISRVFRKKYTMVGLFISSIMCLLLAILTAFQSQDNKSILDIVQTIALLINRFVLCSTWAIFYVYIAELYPTTVRSLGFGWASAIGTIGSSISPYFSLLAQLVGISTWISPAALGITGAVSAYFLAETWGKQLKNQIQQRQTGQAKQQRLQYTDQQDLYSQQKQSQITNSFTQRQNQISQNKAEHTAD